MKNIKLASILILLLTVLSDRCVKGSQDQFEIQMTQLKTMLIESNQAYIDRTIPVYKNMSYYQWIISWFYPDYYYNYHQSQRILIESEKIAALIVAMNSIKTTQK